VYRRGSSTIRGQNFVALNNMIDFSVSLLAVLKFGAFGFFEWG
jgi:hypothetical protein